MNVQNERFQFQEEFPSYGEMDVEIPGNFADSSWHNNICPSFECEEHGIEIWINFADKNLREDPDAPRFTVMTFDAEVLLETDSWTDVIERINEIADNR